MANTAAVLNILVGANTGPAVTQLTMLDRKLKGTAAAANSTSGVIGGKLGSKAKMAAGVAGLGIAAGIAAKQLYDLGAEFDQAYDTIRVGTGATGKQLEKLKGDFRAVYGQVPSDMKDTGTAIADLNTRLGLTGKPLRTMARDMLDLSRMTGTDVSANIKGVARAFVDWEVPVKKQTQALNGFYRLGQASGMQVGELTTQIQQFGSPLRMLGYDVGEAASMFATFERAGVNTQTMLPGLKFAIKNIAEPTGRAAEVMEEFGIAAGKPERGLKQTMKLISGDALSTTEKISVAMGVFGQRAGPDMAEAIKQGRFEFDDYMRIFKSGNETIRKSALDTNSAGENLAIFWHKIQVMLEPVARWIHTLAADLTAALAGLKIGKALKDVRRFMKTNEDWKASMKALGWVIRALAKVVEWVFTKIFARALKAAAKAFEGLFNVVKGTVRLIGAILRGDLGDAWSAVKQIFRGGAQIVIGVLKGLTAPMRAAAELIGKALGGAFRAAWGTVKGIFRGGANAVLTVIRAIIDAINFIPGIPDLPKPDKLQRGGSAGGRGFATGWGTFQRGGMLTGGAPSGDSIPALLERGEYVLNRKAVEKVGVRRLDALNYAQAPRFQTGGQVGLQTGGRVGMILGGVADAAMDAAGAVANAVGDVASTVLKPVKWYLGKLPSPDDIPEPFDGTGRWAIDKAKDWITDKVADLFSSSASANAAGYSGPPANFSQLGDNAWVDSHTLAVASYLSRKFGVSISSSYRTPEHNASVGGVPGSLHTHGSSANPGAIDFVPANSAMQNFVGAHIAGIQENLIHDVGSGLHNHVGFFSLGGLVRRLARGGLVKASVYGFGEPGTGTEGYKGDYLPGRHAWAELGYDGSGDPGTANLYGGKPYGYKLDISRAGKKVRGVPKLDIGGGGPANPVIDLWEHTARALGLGSTFLGMVRAAPSAGGGGGSEGGRPAEPTKQEIYTRRIAKLRQAVKKSKGRPARESALWALVEAWARYGALGKKGRQHVLSRVQKAGSQARPFAGIPMLQSLAQWLSDRRVADTADPEFGERVAKARAAAQGRGKKARKRLLSRISGRGSKYPAKGRIRGLDDLIARAQEMATVYETQAGYTTSPGGTEITEGELRKQVRQYEKVLRRQESQLGLVRDSIPIVRAKRQAFAQAYQKVRKDKDSPLRWKLGALKRGRDNADAALGALFSKRTALVGITGKAGEIGETRTRLDGLKGTSTSESQRYEAMNALLREQLATSRKTLAVTEAQMPIFSQFTPRYHGGGIVPGRAEQPAVLMGGEGVFTREQMAALGGPVEVTIVIEDGAIDAGKIRAEVKGYMGEVVTKTRTGRAGRKYVTNG